MLFSIKTVLQKKKMIYIFVLVGCSSWGNIMGGSSQSKHPHMILSPGSSMGGGGGGGAEGVYLELLIPLF